MSQPHVAQTVVKQLFQYAFLALGIIFLIIGAFQGSKLITGSYVPDWGNSCDYIATEPMPVASDVGKGVPAQDAATWQQDKDRRLTECQKQEQARNTRFYASTQRDTIFFLIVGGILTYTFGSRVWGKEVEKSA